MFATAFIILANFLAVTILNLVKLIQAWIKKKNLSKIRPDSATDLSKHKRYNKNQFLSIAGESMWSPTNDYKVHDLPAPYMISKDTHMTQDFGDEKRYLEAG